MWVRAVHQLIPPPNSRQRTDRFLANHQPGRGMKDSSGGDLKATPMRWRLLFEAVSSSGLVQRGRRKGRPSGGGFPWAGFSGSLSPQKSASRQGHGSSGPKSY